MNSILITGGTGMIGKALTKILLEKGYRVIILTRNKAKAQKFIAQKEDESDLIRYAEWNTSKNIIDEDAIATADYIVHLAGAGVSDKRWTKKRKQEIVNSRTYSGKLIADSLKKIPNHVKAVISASAIGWYNPKFSIKENDNGHTEDEPADDSFLGQTCKDWEKSIERVKLLGKRLVKFRTGIVLSNDGGAFPEFKKPLHFGLATILGSGKQIISWVHIDDLVKMYIEAIENEKFSGVYNAVAPHPVSNKEFVLRLAKIMKGNFFILLRVPSFVLKFVLGEMSIEVLKSTAVSCSKIQKQGFTFQYPEIGKALQQLIG